MYPTRIWAFGFSPASAPLFDPQSPELMWDWRDGGNPHSKDSLMLRSGDWGRASLCCSWKFVRVIHSDLHILEYKKAARRRAIIKWVTATYVQQDHCGLKARQAERWLIRPYFIVFPVVRWEQTVSKYLPCHKHRLCKTPNDFFCHKAVNYGNHLAISEKAVFFSNCSSAWMSWLQPVQPYSDADFMWMFFFFVCVCDSCHGFPDCSSQSFTALLSDAATNPTLTYYASAQFVSHRTSFSSAQLVSNAPNSQRCMVKQGRAALLAALFDLELNATYHWAHH